MSDFLICFAKYVDTIAALATIFAVCIAYRALTSWKKQKRADIDILLTRDIAEQWVNLESSIMDMSTIIKYEIDLNLTKDYAISAAKETATEKQSLGDKRYIASLAKDIKLDDSVFADFIDNTQGLVNELEERYRIEKENIAKAESEIDAKQESKEEKKINFVNALNKFERAAFEAEILSGVKILDDLQNIWSQYNKWHEDIKYNKEVDKNFVDIYKLSEILNANKKEFKTWLIKKFPSIYA